MWRGWWPRFSRVAEANFAWDWSPPGCLSLRNAVPVPPSYRRTRTQMKDAISMPCRPRAIRPLRPAGCSNTSRGPAPSFERRPCFQAEPSRREVPGSAHIVKRRPRNAQTRNGKKKKFLALRELSCQRFIASLITKAILIPSVGCFFFCFLTAFDPCVWF